jgi:hypothetical protein
MQLFSKDSDRFTCRMIVTANSEDSAPGENAEEDFKWQCTQQASELRSLNSIHLLCPRQGKSTSLECPVGDMAHS